MCGSQMQGGEEVVPVLLLPQAQSFFEQEEQVHQSWVCALLHLS
jgi:hypothetical protein